MRIYTLLAIVVVVLTGVPAESFAGIIAPQRQVTAVKKVAGSTTVIAAPRQQVRQLLTKSPAYR